MFDLERPYSSGGKKIIRASGIIEKIRHFVTRNTGKLIYYALVYPYLIYGNLIWGNTYKTRIQKIMNIQKKIVRLITFKSYLEHTEPIFKELGILDIFKINDYLTAMFMFRYHHLKNLPEVFENYFVTNNQIHQYNMRNVSKLYKCYKRTNYVKHNPWAYRAGGRGGSPPPQFVGQTKPVGQYSLHSRAILAH